MTACLTPLSIDVYGGYSPDYVIIDLDRKIEKQQLYLKCQFYLFLLMRIRKIIINACHCVIEQFKSAMISSEIDARSASTRSNYYRDLAILVSIQQNALFFANAARLCTEKICMKSIL